MKTLNIPGFDQDLKHRIKVAAAQRGTTMKALIEEACRQALDAMEKAIATAGTKTWTDPPPAYYTDPEAAPFVPCKGCPTIEFCTTDPVGCMKKGDQAANAGRPVHVDCALTMGYDLGSEENNCTCGAYARWKQEQRKAANA